MLSPRMRVALAIGLVGLGLWVRHTAARMDARFFALSLSGVQALALYTLGDYSRAARAYRADLRERDFGGLPPGDPSWHALIRDHLDEAERTAREALRADPRQLGPQLTLVETALSRGDDAAARHLAQEILRVRPEQVDALLLLSVGLARSGDHGAAIDALNRALATDRIESRLTVFLWVLETTGDLERRPARQRPAGLLAHYHRYLRIFDPTHDAVALRYAEQAIAEGDRPADAYLTMGIVYDKQQKRDPALAAFLKAIAIDPRHAEALRWAALAYADRGDVVGEYRMAKAALDAAPDDPRYLQPVAHVVLEKLGDPVQAMTLARSAVARQPDNAAAWFWLGQAHTLLGEHGPAAEAFSRAAALRPDAEYWEGAGYSLHQLGRLEEAEVAFRRALALAPGRRQSWLLLGHLYRQIARYPEAIDAYRAAFQRGAPTASELVNLCGLYLFLGRYQEAVPCYRTALAQDPQNSRAQSELPMALQGLKQEGRP